MNVGTIGDIRTTTVIVSVLCGECGEVFGLSDGFRKARLSDGATFYCPNGHPRDYVGGKTMTNDWRADEAIEAAAVELERYLTGYADKGTKQGAAIDAYRDAVARAVLTAVVDEPSATRYGLALDILAELEQADAQ